MALNFPGVRDFPGGPVVRPYINCRGPWSCIPGRELRSAKTKQNKTNKPKSPSDFQELRGCKKRLIPTHGDVARRFKQPVRYQTGRCATTSHRWFMMGAVTLNNTVTSREVIFPSINFQDYFRKKKISFVLACPKHGSNTCNLLFQKRETAKIPVRI